jgi:hypothetical protein
MKLGRSLHIPWSFIELLMMIHVIFHLPYRQLEGFLKKLWELIPEINRKSLGTRPAVPVPETN